MEESIKKNPVVMKWKLIGLAIFLIFTAIIGGNIKLWWWWNKWMF